ncbi:hypothetical protein KC19_11G063000 [Ceratodon purpureus]|uniref:Glycine cleavage system H protein n=1 Tax=Ceratodon purpureus TaxID=3225 RepID=A0A8T0GCV9_CERPU|nr:hypothetical protein KC19_11G063000 [Ceratodon purpureus]
MAFRSAAAQAATLLRLSTRPAAQSLWVPLARRISSTPFASDEVRPGLYYADSHEWVKVEGDIGIVGITDHAQLALGDLVFCELPEEGTKVDAKVKFGQVESVKAVSDVNSPISGEVVEFNSSLSDNPQLLNTDPYEQGWMIKVKLANKSEVESLMSPEKYEKFQAEDHH